MKEMVGASVNSRLLLLCGVTVDTTDVKKSPSGEPASSLDCNVQGGRSDRLSSSYSSLVEKRRKEKANIIFSIKYKARLVFSVKKKKLNGNFFQLSFGRPQASVPVPFR